MAQRPSLILSFVIGLNWRGLSSQDYSSLETHFSEKEIKEAVFDLGCLKSLDCDGIT